VCPELLQGKDLLHIHIVGVESELLILDVIKKIFLDPVEANFSCKIHLTLVGLNSQTVKVSSSENVGALMRQAEQQGYPEGVHVYHGEWSVFSENSPVQPDLLIALNCGLAAKQYNWNPVILRVVQNKIPFLATDYTLWSASMGASKLLECHHWHFGEATTPILLQPTFNPFRRMLRVDTGDKEGNETKEKYRISNGYMFGLNVYSPLEPNTIFAIVNGISNFKPVEYFAHVLSPGVLVRLQGVSQANGKVGTIGLFVPESGPATWKYKVILETGGRNQSLTVRPSEFVKADTVVRVDNDYYNVLSHDPAQNVFSLFPLPMTAGGAYSAGAKGGGGGEVITASSSSVRFLVGSIVRVHGLESKKGRLYNEHFALVRDFNGERYEVSLASFFASVLRVLLHSFALSPSGPCFLFSCSQARV